MRSRQSGQVGRAWCSSEAEILPKLIRVRYEMIQKRDDKKKAYEPFKIRVAMMELDKYLRIFIIPQIPAEYKDYREVIRQSIRDKTVNHFVANEHLLPLLEPSLIDTNVATRKGYGSSYAMKMIKRYISQMQVERPGAPIYVLKIDISKYFYTISHKTLFKMLKKRIKDKDVLEILRRIVDETNKPYVNRMIDVFNRKYETEIPHYEKGRGLSIGAVTSQFLAIYYLSDLDHYIKEELKCKWYIRYMDDFLIMGWDKAKPYGLKGVIRRKLEALGLKMNEKSAVYNCCSETGFPFLGYRYCVVNGKMRIVCLAGTVRRVRKRLKMLYEYDYKKYLRSRESYRGYFMNVWPMVVFLPISFAKNQIVLFE